MFKKILTWLFFGTVVREVRYVDNTVTVNFYGRDGYIGGHKNGTWNPWGSYIGQSWVVVSRDRAPTFDN